MTTNVLGINSKWKYRLALLKSFGPSGSVRKNGLRLFWLKQIYLWTPDPVNNHYDDVYQQITAKQFFTGLWTSRVCPIGTTGASHIRLPLWVLEENEIRMLVAGNYLDHVYDHFKGDVTDDNNKERYIDLLLTYKQRDLDRIHEARGYVVHNQQAQWVPPHPDDPNITDLEWPFAVRDPVLSDPFQHYTLIDKPIDDHMALTSSEVSEICWYIRDYMLYKHRFTYSRNNNSGRRGVFYDRWYYHVSYRGDGEVEEEYHVPF